MPHITARDGIRLYYERPATARLSSSCMNMPATTAPGSRRCGYFSRAHRCITYSQRGYPPSDVPEDGARYGQDIARDDVIAVMDALKIDKAHVVGHSMGAATALHVGIQYPAALPLGDRGRLRLWLEPRSQEGRGDARGRRARPARCSRPRAWRPPRRDMPTAPMRQTQKNKDPRGFAEFAKMLGEHSAKGHALTMLQSAGQAADAVGDGSRPEEILGAAAW